MAKFERLATRTFAVGMTSAALLGCGGDKQKEQSNRPLCSSDDGIAENVGFKPNRESLRKAFGLQEAQPFKTFVINLDCDRPINASVLEDADRPFLIDTNLRPPDKPKNEIGCIAIGGKPEDGKVPGPNTSFRKIVAACAVYYDSGAGGVYS